MDAPKFQEHNPRWVYPNITTHIASNAETLGDFAIRYFRKQEAAGEIINGCGKN